MSRRQSLEKSKCVVKPCHRNQFAGSDRCTIHNGMKLPDRSPKMDSKPSPRNQGPARIMAGIATSDDEESASAKPGLARATTMAASIRYHRSGMPTNLSRRSRSRPTRRRSSVSLRKSQGLLNIIELVNTNMPAQMVIKRAVDAAAHISKAQVVNFFRESAATQEMTCTAASKMPNGAPNCEGLSVPLDLGIVGFVAKTGRTVNIKDVSKDWRHSKEVDGRNGVVVHSVLCVPIRNELGHTIALLEAINSGLMTGFSQEDEAQLKSIACLCDSLMRKQTMGKQLDTQIKQTEALHAIAGSLATASDLETARVIEKIVEASRLVVPEADIRFFVVMEQNKQLCLSGDSKKIKERKSRQRRRGGQQPGGNAVGNDDDDDDDHSDEEDELLLLPLDEGIIGHVAGTGTPITCEDTTQHWRYSAAHDRPGSLLAVPVKDFLGKTIAVTAASHPPGAKRHFSPRDERLLMSLAATAAGVLKQAQLYEEAVRRREQTQALLQITELMSADIGTEMVVPRIIDAAYKLVDAERISMFTVDVNNTKDLSQNQEAAWDRRGTAASQGGQGQEMMSPASHVRHLQRRKELTCIVSKDNSMLGRRVEWGSGLVGHVAMTGKSLNILDAYNDGRFDNKQDEHNHFVTRSIVTVPVIDSTGSCVAVIQAINRRTSGVGGRSGCFTQEDVVNLESLAVSSGIALQKSKMFHALLCSEKKSRALMNLLKVVSMKSATMRMVIDGIVQVAYDALDADRVTIFFVDADRGQMFSIVSRDSNVKGARFPIGQGVAGYVALTRQLLNVEDAYASEHFDPSFDRQTGYRTQSILSVPVTDHTGAHTLAVVQALNKRRPFVSRGDHFSMGAGLHMDSERARSTGEFTSPSSRLHAYVPGLNGGDQEAAMNNQGGGASNKPRFTSFNKGDEEILDSIARQIRVTIRKCHMDAILEEHTAPESNPSVRSMLELYQAPLGPHADNSHFEVEPVPDRRPSSASEFQTMLLDSGQVSYVWPADGLRKAVDALHDRTFNVWQYDDEAQLLGLTMGIFKEMGVLDLDIEVPVMQNFILAVKNAYVDNPFHNFRHGFSVLQFAFLALRNTGATEFLSSMDVVALLVGALCHDIDHPGNTNSFEINSNSRLALRHNDRSVLENHHASTTFKILQDPKCNIFARIEPDSRRELRKTIIAAILSTDMTFHFEVAKKLASIEHVSTFDQQSEADRQFLVDMLIHSADLSGQCYPMDSAAKWEECIAEEFSMQASAEEKLGLPVAPFMQNLDVKHIRAQFQVNFIDFVLSPWWQHIARILPGLNDNYKQLLSNREVYQQIADEGKAKAEAEAAAAEAEQENEQKLEEEQAQPPSAVKGKSAPPA